jgi:hypothetical protein
MVKIGDFARLSQISVVALQQGEVEKRIAEEHSRLIRIDARLRQIEMEHKMSK